MQIQANFSVTLKEIGNDQAISFKSVSTLSQSDVDLTAFIMS